MKKFSIIYLMLMTGLSIISTHTFAQKTDPSLIQILKVAEIDENQNLTYVKVIDCPGMTKNDIYNRANAYFTYNYNSPQNVLQTQDKESGLIIAKGLYADIYKFMSVKIHAEHIVRIDIKEGKARVILSLTNYDIYSSVNGINNHDTPKITDCKPIGKKGMKGPFTNHLLATHERAYNNLLTIEKALKEGNTSSSIENREW